VRGTIVALAGDALREKPSLTPRLQHISPVSLEHQTTYDGPTWLDQATISKWRPEPNMPGFAAELRQALAERASWLSGRQLAEVAMSGEIVLKPDMMQSLRQRELQRLTAQLSQRLGAVFIPTPPGGRASGIYDGAITTPTGKIAVIRREDTFTLAPWRPVFELMRGRAVTGLIGRQRVSWALDRGRALPSRGP
jgi:Protein of unknown function (DUF3363)